MCCLEEGQLQDGMHGPHITSLDDAIFLSTKVHIWGGVCFIGQIRYLMSAYLICEFLRS